MNIIAAAYLILVFMPRDMASPISTQAIPYGSYQACNEAILQDGHRIFGLTVEEYCIHGTEKAK